MGIFHDNFRYIRDSLSDLRNRSYSLQNLADLFGVKKLTIYGWLSQNKNPLQVSLQSVARNTKELLGWNITPEELLNTNIRKKYNIENKKEEGLKLIEQSYVTNIIDFSEISNRLKMLRENRGWSLKYVEKSSQKLFPYNPEYHISHTHVADIEKKKVVNYHINKMKSLATIYGVTLDYILHGRDLPKTITVDRENDLLIIPLRGQLKNISDGHILEIAQKLFETIILLGKNEVEKER